MSKLITMLALFTTSFMMWGPSDCEGFVQPWTQNMHFSRSQSAHIPWRQKNILPLYKSNEDDSRVPTLVVQSPRTRTIEKDQKEDAIFDNGKPNIVMVIGFESFNRDLYRHSAEGFCNVHVFADKEIRVPDAAAGTDDESVINPVFLKAMKHADAFVGSLIFDYDDVLAIQKVLPSIQGPRLLFECALELMTFNEVRRCRVSCMLLCSVLYGGPCCFSIGIPDGIIMFCLLLYCTTPTR
jgi:hypothetical protein